MGRHVGADNKISDKTDDFAPTDTIYASVHTKGGSAPTQLVARWTMGDDSTVVHEETQTVQAGVEADTKFTLVPAGGLKKGKYTVHIMADGKETREIDGRHYVLETALKADVSLVKAWKADKAGNLVFRKTARNFNPAAAMAGRTCVAEVEELVEIGQIDPDHVHLPGIYVQRIVVNANPEKRIEQRTIRAEAN